MIYFVSFFTLLSLIISVSGFLSAENKFEVKLTCISLLVTLWGAYLIFTNLK